MVTPRKNPGAAKPFVIPDACPPILRQLIEKAGSSHKAAKLLGMKSSGGIHPIAHGTSALTDKMRERIEAALKGETVTADPKYVAAGSKRTGRKTANGHADEAPPVVATTAEPVPPPFVEWDGKTVAVKVEGKYGRDDQKFKKCPIPIAVLLQKYDYSRLNAARAIGYSNASPITDILTGDREFDLKLQKKVHNALHGVSERDTSEFTAADTFAMGLAICLVALSGYERLEELAEVMRGALLMRKSAGNAGWLVIWRFPKREDLQSFKRLGIRDAKEIICP